MPTIVGDFNKIENSIFVLFYGRNFKYGLISICRYPLFKLVENTSQKASTNITNLFSVNLVLLINIRKKYLRIETFPCCFTFALLRYLRWLFKYTSNVNEKLMLILGIYGCYPLFCLQVNFSATIRYTLRK